MGKYSVNQNFCTKDTDILFAGYTKIQRQFYVSQESRLSVGPELSILFLYNIFMNPNGKCVEIAIRLCGFLFCTFYQPSLIITLNDFISLCHLFLPKNKNNNIYPFQLIVI